MMVENVRSCTAEHATMRETSHFEPVSTQILHEKKHCTVDATIACESLVRLLTFALIWLHQPL